MRALSKDLIYFSKEKENDKDLAINFLTYFERKIEKILNGDGQNYVWSKEITAENPKTWARTKL